MADSESSVNVEQPSVESVADTEAATTARWEEATMVRWAVTLVRWAVTLVARVDILVDTREVTSDQSCTVSTDKSYF